MQGHSSEPISVTSGVHQISVLSPILFLVFMKACQTPLIAQTTASPLIIFCIKGQHYWWYQIVLPKP